MRERRCNFCWSPTFDAVAWAAVRCGPAVVLRLEKWIAAHNLIRNETFDTGVDISGRAWWNNAAFWGTITMFEAAHGLWIFLLSCSANSSLQPVGDLWWLPSSCVEAAVQQRLRLSAPRGSVSVLVCGSKLILFIASVFFNSPSPLSVLNRDSRYHCL